MDEFSEAIENFKIELSEASKPAYDVTDPLTRKALDHIIRAVGQLGVAIIALGKANR